MTRSAIVIGDLQTGITSNYAFAADLVPRAARLAGAARTRGDLIVFVHTEFRASGVDVTPQNPAVHAIFSASNDYHEGSAGTELDPGLGRQPADVVVTKRRASAFTGTDLELVLRSSDIKTVAIAGVATSAMVTATAYDAADRDYQVRVIADVSADPRPGVHEFLTGTIFPGQGIDVVSSGDFLASGQ